MFFVLFYEDTSLPIRINARQNLVREGGLFGPQALRRGFNRRLEMFDELNFVAYLHTGKTGVILA